jgi:hypothetical protein
MYDNDIHYGKWDDIVNLYVSYGCDKEIVEKIMKTVGFHSGDEYIVLCSEDDQGEGPIGILSSICLYLYGVDLFDEELDLLHIKKRYTLMNVAKQCLKPNEYGIFNQKYRKDREK